MKRTAQFWRTTRDITNAFLEILKNKPFEKIVISDILETAMINRSTFYAHFSDKYEVVEYLQEKYVTELLDLIDRHRLKNSIDLTQIDLLMREYFLKNRESLTLLTKIHTQHIDFISGFRQIFLSCFRNTFPNLNELELSMMSAAFIEFFLYFLEHETPDTSFAQMLYHSCAHVSFSLFGISASSDADKDLLALMERWRCQ